MIYELLNNMNAKVITLLVITFNTFSTFFKSLNKK